MLYFYKPTKISQEINKAWSEFEQSISRSGFARNSRLFFYLLSLLGATVCWQSASAQTFDIASGLELDTLCADDQDFQNFGTPLSVICQGLTGGGATGSSGVGIQSQPNSLLISQQQLKDSQNNKEKEDMVPGGSADVVSAQWGEKFSTFLTVGATHLRHRNNAFEQGYSARIPSVTLGGGYLISKTLETGLAFNYSNSDGDYNTGGGFNVDSYSPLLYINYLPFDNAFTNLVLSYTRQEQTNDRIAIADQFRRNTSSDSSTNQYNLNFLSGYDFSVENLTIGPRLGVDARHWEMNAYQESSNTGLELSYNRQRQTSIQSRLGLSASFAQSIAVGVVIPQISAFWVHEFANDARSIRAQFIQANGITNGFSFLTERPARNWAVIDLGVSFVMQNGIQAFVNFSTIQGNSNFESYGGNLGIRVGL